jgi:uncharacterized membrane protein
LDKLSGKNKKRPVLELPRTYWDWFFDAASLVGLVLMVSCLIYYWPLLPETIPTHFGFSGEADGWGSKTILLILPVAALGLFIILTVLGFFPHTYNYPCKVTEKNARDQYRLARTLLGCLKVEVIWMFLYLVWMSAVVALGHAGGLHPVFAPVFMVIVFGTIGIYFYLSLRAR